MPNIPVKKTDIWILMSGAEVCMIIQYDQKSAQITLNVFDSMLKLCEVVHEPNLKGCVVCCPVGTFEAARFTPSVHVTDGFGGCP